MSSAAPSKSTRDPINPPQPYHYEYTVLPGLFMQSESSTNDTTFDFKNHNFGLIPRLYPTDDPSQSPSADSWPRLTKYLRSLTSSAPQDTRYKLLFLARHGQGVHNVAESFYGTPAWDAHYAALDGADGMIWADALLTPLGEQQAKDVAALWSSQLDLGIPLPETYYVSPLTRAIQTADLTFSSLPLPDDAAYKPFVKELLREALGVHTCDRRTTLSALRGKHAHLAFEAGFSEADLLWRADVRESRAERRARVGLLLDEVFERDHGMVSSFTSHSGAIGCLLEVLRHREWALETGGVVPVVVRGVRIEGARGPE